MAPHSIQGLGLKVEGPHTISDVADLKITSTFTNTTGSTLTLVNDPSSILTTKYPTERYHIIHSSGVKPIFKGIRIKFSPKIAADLGNVTVLEPGQSITSVAVTHDISQTHDFTYPGNGQYTFKPKNTFYAVDPITKEVHLIQGDTSSSISVYISGLNVQEKVMESAETDAEKPADANDDVNEIADKTGEKKDIKFENCTDDQKAIITTAANNAVNYVSSCQTYINTLTASTARYKTWFGTYTDDRKSTVKSHFDKIGNKPNNVTYDASSTDPDVYAYVYPEDDTKIYLCGAFWNAPATGSNSQAGTIVHESSHFTSSGGTTDKAYGQTACKKLANDNPGDAIMNADSHEYFAENNPSES